MKQNKNILIIGITGQSGTGKSTAAAYLKEMGAYVIDADKIYHKLIEKGTEGYKSIIKYFGTGIVLKNGEINRKKLGDIVFNDEGKLKKLEEMTHLLVSREIKKKVSSIKRKGICKLIVLDVPVPVKEGFLDTADIVLVTECSEEKQISRITKRDKISEKKAKIRLSKQLPKEKYRNIADYVVINEKKEELKKEINNIIEAYTTY